MPLLFPVAWCGRAGPARCSPSKWIIVDHFSLVQSALAAGVCPLETGYENHIKSKDSLLLLEDKNRKAKSFACPALWQSIFCFGLSSHSGMAASFLQSH